MGLARELELRLNFRSRGADQMHRDLAMLTRDMKGMERRPGARGMGLSYGAEQAATQIDRVARGARRSIEATVGLAADFEDQMGRVAALSTRGMTEFEAVKTVDALSKKARELGATTRYTAREAGAGMEFLAMAGFDAQKQMETIPAVLNLATVGNIKVARAADIATNIMGGFQMGAEESTKMVDRLASALTSGNVTMTELGNAMSYAAPQAKMLNQDLEDMLGWMDLLGDAGIKGSKAGTGTRSILISLQDAATGKTKKSGRNRKIFEQYGVDLLDKETGKFRDATTILSELGLAMAKSGKSDAEIAGEVNAIFGQRFGTAASVLMASGAKGLGAMDKDLKSLEAVMGTELTEDQRKKIWEGQSLQSRIGKVRESDGLAKQMATKMDATTKGQWRAFKSALEETGIVIGEQVLPILIDLMKELKPWVESLAKWSKRNPEIIKGLAKTLIAVIGIGAIVTPVLHTMSALTGLGGLGKKFAGGLGLPVGLEPRGAIGGGLSGFFPGSGDGGGGGRGGAGVGGRGRRRPRTVEYFYGPGEGMAGPRRREVLELGGYDTKRGFGLGDSGALTWSAGNNSPDMVRASAEAEYTQRQREARANRRARFGGLGGGWGRGSRGYAQYQAQQAELRRQEREEAKAQRRQDRANRRAASRAASRDEYNKAGMLGKGTAASIGFGIGQAIMPLVDTVFKEVFGGDTSVVFDSIAQWSGVADSVTNLAHKWYGTEKSTDKTPITNQRGGAKFKTDIEGLTAEGKKRLEQVEQERKLAADLGVTYETVRRAREQGIDANKLKDQTFLRSFVAGEQARDASIAQRKKKEKQRAALMSEKAKDAWARAKAGGASDERAEMAAKATRARMQGIALSGSSGMMTIYDRIAESVARGIQSGVDGSNPLEALIPKTAVAGAEAGG